MAAALRTMILLLSAHAFGSAELAITDFHVIRIGNFDALAEFSAEATTAWDERSGLSLATRAVVITYANPWNTLWSTSFEIGEHVILCFEPSRGMYVRIFDFTPSGRTHQLFPLEGAAWVEGERTYCAGDHNASAQFYADSASGTGHGVLWISASDSPDQIGSAVAHVAYHVHPGANDLAPTDRSNEHEYHDDTTPNSEPEPATGDQDDAGTAMSEAAEHVRQSTDQALNVVPTCLSRTIRVTYLQHIALTEDASMSVTIDDQRDCGTTEPLPPAGMIFPLHGRQVPLSIHITCSPHSTITIHIHERDLAVFTTTTPCDTLHDHDELILTPATTTGAQPGNTLAFNSTGDPHAVIERGWTAANPNVGNPTTP